VTGQVREVAAPAATSPAAVFAAEEAAAAEVETDLSALEAELAERTADV
jgi:hypothetical protein